MNFADVPARRKVPVLFLSPAIQSFLGYRVIIYGSELIAVAISVAYLYSSAVVFGLEGKYFWELATLIDIMLLGHWIEMRSVLGASRALEELVKIMPSTAHLIRNGEIVEVIDISCRQIWVADQGQADL